MKSTVSIKDFRPLGIEIELLIDHITVFFCVGVMYSGEYDACDVTLSVYPHRASLKNMPDHRGQAYITVVVH
jgi:hypothetical protein